MQVSVDFGMLYTMKTNTNNILTIYTDGGSRGNPGPAATGVVVKRGELLLYEHGEYLGNTTNNSAEYHALLSALSWVARSSFEDVSRVDCFLDSLLVVEQLRGRYKLKSLDLKPLYTSIKSLELSLSFPVVYHHVPREQNQHADRLVNEALDAHTR